MIILYLKIIQKLNNYENKILWKIELIASKKTKTKQQPRHIKLMLNKV